MVILRLIELVSFGMPRKFRFRDSTSLIIFINLSSSIKELTSIEAQHVRYHKSHPTTVKPAKIKSLFSITLSSCEAEEWNIFCGIFRPFINQSQTNIQIIC